MLLLLSGSGGFRLGNLGRIHPLNPDYCEDRQRSDYVNTELPMPDPKLHAYDFTPEMSHQVKER